MGTILASDLLNDVSAFVIRFVSLSQAQADVCALWTVHTHAIDAADFTPYLDIHSPVLRSGKTRLLEVHRLLVKKPWFTGRVTGSALVRKTHAEHPTLLLDESDAAFNMKGEYGESLRGILNSGFERDGTYSMSVGKKTTDWTAKDFSTFSPKAIAGIGKLPGTVQDRSIPIELKRARTQDKRQRFRKRDVGPEAEVLRKRIEQWVTLNLAKLKEAQPNLPDELNDRHQDVCEPLLAIADRAGGDWPQRARAALVFLCTDSVIPDDSVNLKLLADIRDIFEKEDTDRLATQTLLSRLDELEESPWAEFTNGNLITAYQLSKLLRPFGVRPRDIRSESRIYKGYLRESFDEVWERYLDPSSHDSVKKGQQALQPSIHAGQSTISAGQHDVTVALFRNAKPSVFMRSVAGVAPSEPHNGNGAHSCRTHPANCENWWMRGTDPVCGLCHPSPHER